MPKPAYPIPGDPISSAWGTEMIDYAGEKWRYVSTPVLTALNDVDGQTVMQSLELTNLPLNDPNVVAAEIALMARLNSGSTSHNIAAYDFVSGNEAGRSYVSGVTSRGGYSGNFKVMVGGTNNRQIKWNSSLAGATLDCWLYCFGYWVRETIVP